MESFSKNYGRITRRHFVKISSITAVGVSSVGLSPGRSFNEVSLIAAPNDAIAGSKPSLWAINELQKSLVSKDIDVTRYENLENAKPDSLCILAAGSNFPVAKKLLSSVHLTIPEAQEALGLIPVEFSGRSVLLATGYDARGLIYALLELTDRVNCSDNPLQSLLFSEPIIEKPANVIRSINRLFVSETEDKGWFNDRKMWPEYLTMITTQRFNRFNLSLGIGYDFLQNVTDGYFLFAYPFFLSVPGYNVHVPELPDEERDRNLEMLQFISDETAARGIQFQLGIWMHGYKWLNSPNPNYTIEGLTPETHAAYCRDAVRELLKKCPAISGITFRIHGESGITEGSYNFWGTIFEGVATCGRKVEIDLHSKGMDPKMIETALSPGLPVTISPKYWGEHLGMPYHQADIRSLEVPKENQTAIGLMNLSSGSRSFTRYGYADLLKENRRYGVLYRIWPGTQRLLLWGDPMISAAHSRAFSFCGSVGVDLMEPLSFKGRRGSGIAGSRCGYLDSSLDPKWDWQKYLYSLRIFGRMAFNPETKSDVWQRYLKMEFGKASEAVELALANATRILPIVLTVHAASAGNNSYWPEMYLNMSILKPDRNTPYYDSPSPKVFGNVSPMDPQIFVGINDFARELLNADFSGKYSPVEAALWLEDYAATAEKNLKKAEAITKTKDKPEFRRMAIDVAMTIGIGRFFAAKFRSGLLYGIYERSKDRKALELSLEYYKKAREFWTGVANLARPVYKSDITIGENPVIRGHWLDRLPAIDEDIALMSDLLEHIPVSGGESNQNVKSAIKEAVGKVKRDVVKMNHVIPQDFTPGTPLNLEVSSAQKISSVKLFYREVNHAKRFEHLEMKNSGEKYMASVPGTYTDTEYPLQYYFVMKDKRGKAWMYPGFNPELNNSPYFIVRKI